MRDRLEVSALMGLAAFLLVIVGWEVIDLWNKIGALPMAAIIGCGAAIVTFLVDWLTGRVK